MASGWKRLSSEMMEPNEEVMLERGRNLLSLGAAVRHSVSQDKVQWPSSTAHDSSDNLFLPKSQSRKSALAPLRWSAPVKFLSQHLLQIFLDLCAENHFQPRGFLPGHRKQQGADHGCREQVA